MGEREPTAVVATPKEKLEKNKKLILESITNQLKLGDGAGGFLSSFVDTLCKDSGISAFLNNGEFDKSKLKTELETNPQWKAILEAKKDTRLDTIMEGLTSLPPEQQLKFLLANLETDKGALDAKIKAYIDDNKAPESAEANVPIAREKMARVYAYNHAEIVFDKDVVDTGKTITNLNGKVDRVLGDLRSTLLKQREAIGRQKAKLAKKLRARETNEGGGIPSVIKEQIPTAGSDLDRAGEQVSSLFSTEFQARVPEGNREELEISFGLDFSSVESAILKAKNRSEVDKIFEDLKKEAQDHIKEYVDQNLEGKTKSELGGLFELSDDEKKAYIASIPEMYRDTDYAEGYAKYLSSVSPPKNPPKGFNEFLNENTKINGFGRLIIMLQYWIGKLGRGFGKDEAAKAAKVQARTENLNATARGTTVEKIEEKEVLKANEGKVDAFLKRTEGKWANINIKGIYERDNMEAVIDKRSAYFEQPANVETITTFEKDFLNPQIKEPLKTARTMGFKMDTLKAIKDAPEGCVIVGKDGNLMVNRETIDNPKNKDKKVLEEITKWKENVEKEEESKQLKEKIKKREEAINKKISEIAEASDVPVGNLKELLDIQLNIPADRPNREGALANGLGWKIGIIDSIDFREWLKTSQGNSLLKSKAPTMRAWINSQIDEELESLTTNNKNSN